MSDRGCFKEWDGDLYQFNLPPLPVCMKNFNNFLFTPLKGWMCMCNGTAKDRLLLKDHFNTAEYSTRCVSGCCWVTSLTGLQATALLLSRLETTQHRFIFLVASSFNFTTIWHRVLLFFSSFWHCLSDLFGSLFIVGWVAKCRLNVFHT